MKLLIPAAGEGVRLRPHTLTRPKPMLRIAGKTVIEFVLDPLLELEPSEVAVVVGYRGEQLIEFLSGTYPVKFTMVAQDELLGLGYAVLLGLEALGDEEDVLIILADTIIQADFRRFITAGENTIALKQVEDPRRFGVAEVEEGRITRLEEKPAEPRSNLAVVGLYYFADPAPLRKALRTLLESGRKTSGEVQLTDALADMLNAGAPFTPYTIDGWLDCGKRETMISTSERLLSQLDSRTQTESGNTYRGVNLIAPDCHVANSTIGPNVTLYPNCQIVNSKLESSIIGPGSRVLDSYLKDSILGEGVRLDGASGVADIGDHGLTTEEWEKREK